ncbi:MAG: flagellar hook-associated protein FlgK [Betaproteobacteria bacterium]|nr:flagellar hook-associated protein FlgK [Betaproteobacteria bacterium]
MASGILNIGASGLTAAYAALQTTGHNIANVSTPGYKRQQTNQTSTFGAGYIGNGVSVTNVSRVYSELASSEANRAEARASEAGAQAAYIGRLDRLLGDSTSGVGAAVDSFFNSLQALSAQPSSTAQRTAFLDETRNLAARFSEAIDGINILKDTAARDLSLSLNNINEMGRQVASLNSAISLALASGMSPNDLMDQRDNLIRNIAGEIGVTTIEQSDGSVNLLVGNGQPLVVGDRVSKLVIGADPADPDKVALILQGPAGNVMVGSDGSAMGGKVAAMMNIHNRDLAGAEAELGRLAIAIATPLNQQHQRGLDLNGNSGGDLFTLPAAVSYPLSTNTGNAAVNISIADASQLKASDYRLDFDGANYQLTRLSDSTQQSFAAMPATVDGFGISIASGAMAAGDSFTLKPVSTRAGGIAAAFMDPQRVALALPVAANATLGNAGNIAVQGLSLDATPNANLTQPVTLTFTGPNTFDVAGVGTGNQTAQTYTAGTPISFNGWTLDFSGTPRAGDTVTIRPNTNPAGDNRNGLNLAAFESGGIVDGRTPAQSFAATLANVGSQARAANLDARIQGAVRDDAVAAEQSFSGVNLDEEAARLMQYQQAYQAAAKVIATAQTVFDALLSLGR